MRKRLLSPAAVGSISAAVAMVVCLLAFATEPGMRVDAAVFWALTEAGIPQLRSGIEGIVLLAGPSAFALIGSALTLAALARRRTTLAVIVPIVLVAANATTQGLQDVIPALVDRPVVGADFATAWPSGHATAAMSLALCGMLVVSPLLRPAAAMLGAAYAVAVGYAQIALGNHLPSEVLGGYLIAASFALLGVAVQRALKTHRPGHAGTHYHLMPSVAAPAIGALAVLLVACVAVVGTDPDSARITQHIPALALGSGIAALGVLLIAGMRISLRQGEQTRSG